MTLVACYRRRAEGSPLQLGVVDPVAGVLRPLEQGTLSGPPEDGVVVVAGEPVGAMAPALPLEDVVLRPPIPRPRRNIFCIGKNYKAHALEFDKTSDAVPAHPVVFTKPPSSVIGDGEAIYAHPGVTAQLDYEAELAVIIGRGGRGIAKERAFEHVWGYTVVNDVTARDLQRAHQQWFLGKGLDTFCPMGPWAVTAEGFDLAGAEVYCRVNGEPRQRAPVSDLVFDIPTLIAAISAGITLEVGDVIATGTPAGVGAAFDPPRFLQPGDVVEAGVTGIGTLTNVVRG
jgi:2-keto-4-pentenoate hydratase/2-oxohepta-3-ene-1,7-dioic acid hydratase in catechol pathway